MAGSGIVVGFPDGRPLRSAPRGCRGHVAKLVRKLTANRSCRGTAEPDAPLQIGLCELAGIRDETVTGLSLLARKGIVTPTSAVRLALRHANECTGSFGHGAPTPSGAARFELALAGDPFGRFAFRLRGRSAWLAFAPETGFGLLPELCHREPIQLCVLVGCGANRQTTVSFLTSADWFRRLDRVAHGGGGQEGRDVLLIGGLPTRGPAQVSAFAEIERAFRRGGNTQLVSSAFRKQAVPGWPVSDGTRELLRLIELACPGLVEARADGEGAR